MAPVNKQSISRWLLLGALCAFALGCQASEADPTGSGDTSDMGRPDGDPCASEENNLIVNEYKLHVDAFIKAKKLWDGLAEPEKTANLPFVCHRAGRAMAAASSLFTFTSTDAGLAAFECVNSLQDELAKELGVDSKKGIDDAVLDFGFERCQRPSF